MQSKPRRKIVVSAKIEGDSWDDIARALHQLQTDIAVQGELSKTSVSGGYSSGWIVVSDVDGSMTHDKWAADLNAWLDARHPTGSE